MKTCTTCHVEKQLTEFNRKASSPDGYAPRCRECSKLAKREAYAANPEKQLAASAEYRRENPEKVSAAKKRCYEAKKPQYAANQRAYYEENREEILASTADYRSRNIESVRERDRAYKASHRRQAVRYMLDKVASDPRYRLASRMRSRLKIALSNRGYTKISKTTELLGCDWLTLKMHIESQFVDGMTWGNRREWHVDHRVPLAIAKDEAEMARLFHYTNLQPLWALDNLSKGAKVLR